VLGPVTAAAVVVGTVIGSGIFKKPQALAEHVPYFGLTALAWVLGGAWVLLGALAYAEVAVLYPRAGGNYVFLREAYGRLAGFLWGWVEFWIIRTGSIAALATIFTESLHDVLTNPALREALGLSPGGHLGFWERRAVTVAVLVGLAWVNVRGVRWGGVLQLLVTLVKVVSLVALAVLPFVAARLAGMGAARPDPANLEPVWPAGVAEVGFGGLGIAFLGVLWAYHGWMNVAQIAEEVRRPQRNLPLALLVGVGVVIALYLGANLAFSLVLPREEMAALKQTPVSTEFCLRLLGPLGAAVASAAVMLSTFGALAGNLLVGPRLLYAMGADGLAPEALRRVHPRYHTPAAAIWVLAAWSVGLVLGVAALTEAGWLDPRKSHFDRLTDFAMFGAVIFETLAVLSIFVFRRRRPDAERPYRCPGYPLVPALYAVLPACMVVNTLAREQTRAEALGVVGFIALGVAVYLALGLGRGRTSSEFPVPSSE
jgi:amino acid transporter